METTNRYAPPKADLDDVAGTAAGTAPALWNPGAAASWSLVFTPVLGAALQMKNWEALGQPDKARQSRAWMIGVLVATVVLSLAGVLLGDSKGMDGVARAGGIGLLVGWYYANGKEQMAYVKARYGKEYPRRGWGKALGWAVLAYAGFFVALVVVGFFIGMGRHV